jgi:PadR family transcriptional regulator, regulatory protein PadR
MEQDNLRDNFIQELRRGVLILAVLGSLGEEQYGYSIMKNLSDRGLDVDQGTLYPLLRRLETQGLLESKWRMEEARPRRYYIISAEGRTLLPVLHFEFEKLSGIVSQIMTK